MSDSVFLRLSDRDMQKVLRVVQTLSDQGEIALQ